MKKLLKTIPAVIILTALIFTSCSTRKHQSTQINEKGNTPMGATSIPDTSKKSSDITPFPNSQPVAIPNPNPNPVSPNPPLR